MVDKRTRFTLRIDNAIYEKVKNEAIKEHRTVTSQIEAILDNYFKEREKE